MNSVPLICPVCGYRLYEDIFSLRMKAEIRCSNCTGKFRSYNGCFNFASKSLEKNFYEERYSKKCIATKDNIDLNKLGNMWFNTVHPERRIFLDLLNSTRCKNILLLGNGDSIKELFLLKHDNRIIYTDISLNAILNVKNKYYYGKYQNRIVFHTVNAYNIPFGNETIDLVLGYLFVHHLDNLEQFFNEINRVLKPCGKCLFYDNAYSRIWQKLKFSIFKSVVNYSHTKSGISPQDTRATYRGGYRKRELEEIFSRFNFSDMTFIRFGLVYPLFYRGIGKIFGVWAEANSIGRRLIPILFRIDNYLSKCLSSYHNNTYNLIWGFTK